MSDGILSPGSAAKWRNTNRPHYVYVFWGRNGECLYVGCTVQPAGRISQHATKPWWRRVDRIEALVYPDKESGRLAETELIHKHEPLFNVQQTEKALGP